MSDIRRTPTAELFDRVAALETRCRTLEEQLIIQARANLALAEKYEALRALLQQAIVARSVSTQPSQD